MQLKPGDVFSREKLAASTKAISDRLGNDGYAFANANAIPNVDKEKRSVAFNIVVDPGRRVYVRRIDVAGNTKTRDEVVRREMRQLEGAFYDASKIQLSRRRIDRTGVSSARSRSRPSRWRAAPTRSTWSIRSRSSPPARCCSASASRAWRSSRSPPRSARRTPSAPASSSRPTSTAAA